MDLELEPLEPQDEGSKKEAEDNVQVSQYTGEERRQEHRRQNSDRRAEVRFEPGAKERRSGKDRRSTGTPWNKLYSL
jgi:hypothetical protein